MTGTLDSYEINGDVWEKICEILDLEPKYCQDLDLLEAIIILKNKTIPVLPDHTHYPYWDNAPLIID